MTSFSLFSISLLIVFQCVLGLALLYRGYKWLLQQIELPSARQAFSQLREKGKVLATSPTLKRVGLVVFLFMPGAIPILLIVALWRRFRQGEPIIVWKSSNLLKAFQSFTL